MGGIFDIFRKPAGGDAIARSLIDEREVWQIEAVDRFTRTYRHPEKGWEFTTQRGRIFVNLSWPEKRRILQAIDKRFHMEIDEMLP